jgi:hypothetical protein
MQHLDIFAVAGLQRNSEKCKLETGFLVAAGSQMKQ